MNSRFNLSVPIDVEGWENIEALEHLVLYEEFAERINRVVELIREGQLHWANHLNDAGEWTVDAVRVLREVRRHSYNIHQRIGLFQDDLASTIRWFIGESTESAFTDCQCVAALALDRACRAIEVLGRWLREFHEDLYSGERDILIALAEESPESFDVLVNEIRQKQASLEADAREQAADFIGAAQHYMILARVYASPVLSSREKTRISVTARKAGNNSAGIRREASADRNQSICSHATRLLNDGRSKREIVGIIFGTDSALKAPGSSAKLSKKQIRNILTSAGILT
ncbi:hypothetical protein [Pseudomonas paraglycinae]|uniref:hypothetical protein n=1 Tax=Pseudomonas paraglycinae TaxID=2892330 RepID=UPI001F170037|nr:hypothetical protein [Pseudomonas paraglycinae]